MGHFIISVGGLYLWIAVETAVKVLGTIIR